MQSNSRPYKKHTFDDKLEVIKLYNAGKGPSIISRHLNIGRAMVHRWIQLYISFGISGLRKRKVALPSGAKKIEIVRDVIDNSLSFEAACLKYNVSATTIRNWKLKVLAHGYGALSATTKRVKQIK